MVVHHSRIGLYHKSDKTHMYLKLCPNISILHSVVQNPSIHMVLYSTRTTNAKFSGTKKKRLKSRFLKIVGGQVILNLEK